MNQSFVDGCGDGVLSRSFGFVVKLTLIQCWKKRCSEIMQNQFLKTGHGVKQKTGARHRRLTLIPKTTLRKSYLGPNQIWEGMPFSR